MERIRKLGALGYGAICYAIFFATFLYLIGFVGDFAVPKSIDSGPAGPLGIALLGNAALLVLFGLQHSVMARPGFKSVFTRVVPKSIERSSYVLASSIALILLMGLWQPIPAPIFELESGFARGAMIATYLLGYGIVLYSTFLIDHFDLFGLRQVFLRALGRSYTEKRFMTPSLYKLIRHPLYVGWIITFWAAPTFTVGHLLFASAMTAYILVAIPLEERDLEAQLGEPYRSWRARTPAFLPRIRRSRGTRPTDAVGEAR
ncbi:MAG: methanethiol S-methyltransferase [Myxococcota bacterium]